jgi:hypothetical protein
MTINDAIRKLQQANESVRSAITKIDEHVEESDYNDMAALVSNAASSLLKAAVHLLEERDEAAFDMLEQADDFLDAAMDVVDEEDLELTDEEEIEGMREDEE